MSLAGSFLIARPVLKDPNFAETVILVLNHDEDGALGLVVNRPMDEKDLPFPVFGGGPCSAPGLFMLHGHAEWVTNLAEPSPAPTKKEIAPGIFVGDESCAERANTESAEEGLRIRIFRGYAGWGPGQLENELASGAWGLVPASGEVLFATPAEELWDRLMPPRIPQPSLN
jgi:putative transcriptional regulator